MLYAFWVTNDRNTHSEYVTNLSLQVVVCVPSAKVYRRGFQDEKCWSTDVFSFCAL